MPQQQLSQPPWPPQFPPQPLLQVQPLPKPQPPQLQNRMKRIRMIQIQQLLLLEQSMM